MEHYLYFPKCKVSRCNLLPGNYSTSFTFLIKALTITPKHYPQHFMLKGKPEFFFKLNFSDLNWKLISDSHFKNIFGKSMNLLKTKELIGTELSVVVQFNSDSDIKLNCIGIGKANELPILFNNNLSEQENSKYTQVSFLEYQLNNNKKKDRKLKI